MRMLAAARAVVIPKFQLAGIRYFRRLAISFRTSRRNCGPPFTRPPSRAGTYTNPPLEVRFCLPGSARRRKEGTLRRFDETSETLKLKNLEMLEFGNYGQKTGSYHGDFVIPARSHFHSLRGRARTF